MAKPSLAERTSGVLLHPTSLPGPHGAGDLGRGARAFIDFLESAGQRFWQMLPVGPVGYGNSPYSVESAFAGNAMLVDVEGLVERGLVDRNVVAELDGARDRVEFDRTSRHREAIRRAAFDRFRARDASEREAHDAFREKNASWLEEYALYRALKRAHDDKPWIDWEPSVRDRDEEALDAARAELSEAIDFTVFEQWLFDEDWRRLRAYAGERGVGLIGDLPIFVAHDSADVWARRDLFFLDDDGRPTVIAGVPPDYFSATGQRWGNPLYRWKRIEKRGWPFWIDRFAMTLERFDVIRLDHFIGYRRYWEIPAHLPTAEIGRWVNGPGKALFKAMKEKLGALPLIAEDLGVVTEGVIKLRDKLGLPGIKILEFAFGTDPMAPTFLPHNFTRASVVYTGTHDNETARGWFLNATEAEKKAALRYLDGDGVNIHWTMIRAAMASVANLCVFPAQDLLGLGDEGRMNRPGTIEDNWRWRVEEGALSTALATRLRDLTETYGRSRA